MRRVRRVIYLKMSFEKVILFLVCMNLSEIIACTARIIPIAATISPALTIIRLPIVIILPRKLNEAPSAGVKNSILPLIKSSYISFPYSFAAASDDRGNLKPFDKCKQVHAQSNQRDCNKFHAYVCG